ncbi:MAG TPA: hypothetical protein VFF88_07850, partial [Methylocella sp.]|nr:hypothetical protein [Methylocella sp.]
SLAQVLRPLGFARIEAVDLPPAAITGLKTLVIAALWRVYRAFMTLRLALETGQLRRVILTLNLHVIAHKDTRNT